MKLKSSQSHYVNITYARQSLFAVKAIGDLGINFYWKRQGSFMGLDVDVHDMDSCYLKRTFTVGNGSRFPLAIIVSATVR